jgi:hypothetical protein
MADAQIWAPDVAAGESVYTVGGTVEFTLKTVNADFTDNGAASAWLPCVLIVSDAGHVIARSVDPAVQVAAGSDASVSFFPGVKHAASVAPSTSVASFAPQQVADMTSYDRAGSDWVGFNAPTIDAACLGNGYVGSSGAQGDFLDMRFALGPYGALWQFDLLLLKGPNYGELFGYLGTPPEDPPASVDPEPTNLLSAIDGSDGNFNYVLAFKVSCWAAALTRNVQVSIGAAYTGHNPYGADNFRIRGAEGAVLTNFTLDPTGNYVNGDGGPGIYALKLVAGDKVGISTGYKLGIQAVAAHRTDWEWA